MRLVPVHFASLDRWDAKAGRVALHRALHPDFRPLGEFIEEVTELVAPWEEPDKEWPVYGVDNVNGVFFSHRQPGSKFRQKYKRIRPGWFFHNPTRSAVGSLGMVPDVPEDAITSPEYQVWRVTGGFLPEFLAIMIRTEAFKRLIRIHRVGAVKERLFVRNLQEITVPVPREGTQRRVVRNYQEVIAASLSAQDDAIRKIDQIDEIVFAAINFPPSLLEVGRNQISVSSWRAVERWDLPFYRSDFVAIDEWLTSNPNTRPLRDVARFASERWWPRDFPDGVFAYIEIGNVDRLHGIVGAELTSVTHAPSRAQYRVRQGDLLVATTRPYLAKLAMVAAKWDGAVCSSGFSIIRGTHDGLDPAYLLFFLKSSIGIRQMERRMSGGSYPAITQDELEKISIVVPDLATQGAVIAGAGKLYASAVVDSRRAQELRDNSLLEVDALVAASA